MVADTIDETEIIGAYRFVLGAYCFKAELNIVEWVKGGLRLWLSKLV